ncbi:MBL fold metallo-hydrolase [Plastorhodobacter daqingensis]|uniref:MBL fold metallo-hydrolase n=1 Tax=Plastorhodobacter daqingensis TaxID=1387281 RepID=A0ABW2UF44_9RHOB
MQPRPGFHPLPDPVPGLRALVAPNPSPMTGPGTNTWLLGEGEVAVIDPGPDEPAHLDAILRTLKPGERITKILVTHAHLDHSPLARALAETTGAPVLAYGPWDAGRSARMAALAEAGIGGGEGVDHGFIPDEALRDGAQVGFGREQLTAFWTPGHFGNHMCFEWRGMIFSGDLVLGWTSSLVSPPDGDMGAYMASLGQLSMRPAARLLAGHGAAIDAPQARISELIAHRRGREAAILAALAYAAHTPRAIAERLYTDIPPVMMPAAERNVLAHLLDLEERGLVHHTAPLPGPMVPFSRAR